MTQTSPRVSSRTRLAIESAERTQAPLNGNDGFSLLKQEPARVRGLDIRFQLDGDEWMCQKLHVWSTDGEGLPAEWTALVARPDVVKAQMFPSTQRMWAASKRRLVAEYTRARDIDPKVLDIYHEIRAAARTIEECPYANSDARSVYQLGALRGMLKGLAGLGDLATHASCFDAATTAEIARLVAELED